MSRPFFGLCCVCAWRCLVVSQLVYYSEHGQCGTMRDETKPAAPGTNTGTEREGFRRLPLGDATHPAARRRPFPCARERERETASRIADGTGHGPRPPTQPRHRYFRACVLPAPRLHGRRSRISKEKSASRTTITTFTPRHATHNGVASLFECANGTNERPSFPPTKKYIRTIYTLLPLL